MIEGKGKLQGPLATTDLLATILSAAAHLNRRLVYPALVALMRLAQKWLLTQHSHSSCSHYLGAGRPNRAARLRVGAAW